jgi:hypothetical protein
MWQSGYFEEIVFQHVGAEMDLRMDASGSRFSAYVEGLVVLSATRTGPNRCEITAWG